MEVWGYFLRNRRTKVEKLPNVRTAFIPHDANKTRHHFVITGCGSSLVERFVTGRSVFAPRSYHGRLIAPSPKAWHFEVRGTGLSDMT